MAVSALRISALPSLTSSPAGCICARLSRTEMLRARNAFWIWRSQPQSRPGAITRIASWSSWTRQRTVKSPLR